MIRSIDGRHRNIRVRVALSRSLLGALLLGAAACQSEAAPQVQQEPRPVQQAPASAAAVTAQEAPVAQVGLARYAERAAPSGEAPPGAQSASAPGAAPSGPTPAGKTEPAPAGESPAKPAAGQVVQGAVVAEEPFSVWLQAVSPVSAGTPAKLEAILVAKPPYHCNAEYPHKFKLGPAPAGLSFPESTVKGMQVTAERSVLAIPVQAQSPGKAAISGTLSFSVCTDERCLVEKRELALELEVK
jgi:hypothetical protein